MLKYLGKVLLFCCKSRRQIDNSHHDQSVLFQFQVIFLVIITEISFISLKPFAPFSCLLCHFLHDDDFHLLH